MKHSDYLGSTKYLAAKDLQTPTIVTIDRFAHEDVGTQPVEQKCVMYLREFEKGVVLNRVNHETLQRLFGDDVQSNLGQRVVLFNDTTVEHMGKRVGGIRLRAIDEMRDLRRVAPASEERQY